MENWFVLTFLIIYDLSPTGFCVCVCSWVCFFPSCEHQDITGGLSKKCKQNIKYSRYLFFNADKHPSMQTYSGLVTLKLLVSFRNDIFLKLFIIIIILLFYFKKSNINRLKTPKPQTTIFEPKKVMVIFPRWKYFKRY